MQERLLQKLKKYLKPFARKIQILTVGEQRAKVWVNQKSLLYLKKVKMQSDELIIINRIQKTLKERYHNIGESMMSGTVDNMEKYKYMLGQAHTCLTILGYL